MPKLTVDNSCLKAGMRESRFAGKGRGGSITGGINEFTNQI
jgi:hypothetical protein